MDNGWRLTGTAVFSLGRRPCHLSYQIDCDAAWHSRSAHVSGWVGTDDVDIALVATPGGHWRVNGRACAAVAGCLDVDLGFTPATNLLQLRRLALRIGEAGDAPAAWLRFPELTVERLEQRYRRLDATRYDYQAPAVGYAGTLEVTEIGFITHYPDLWEMEAIE